MFSSQFVFDKLLSLAESESLLAPLRAHTLPESIPWDLLDSITPLAIWDSMFSLHSALGLPSWRGFCGATNANKKISHCGGACGVFGGCGGRSYLIGNDYSPKPAKSTQWLPKEPFSRGRDEFPLSLRAECLSSKCLIAHPLASHLSHESCALAAYRL